MRLGRYLLLALIALPAYADDQADVVTVPRATFVQLLQDNLAMRNEVLRANDAEHEAEREFVTCVESRST